MIIAVDGPAGAGKSTVAKLLAKRLNFLYLDTGAMYRALTLKVLEEDIDPHDTSRVIQAAKSAKIELFSHSDGSLKVILDGRDISLQIRQPRITRHVSDIAKIKEVRQVMLVLQREFGRQHDTVVDGRDIGTVVFPQAERKFYLDAEFSERVRRRYRELIEAGEEVTRDEIEKDLRNRDAIDSSREFAPLKKAADAIYLDTSNFSIAEVVDRLYQAVKGQ